MSDTEFVKQCRRISQGESLRYDSLTFQELFNLKYPEDYNKNPFFWSRFRVTARTRIPITMRVWNGKHPYQPNVTEHECKAGSRVLIWMVSRMGDIGVTDNLENPNGYDVRGLDSTDLYDWEIEKLHKE